MRKSRKLKIIWKYIGDESPEKGRESEERISQAYNLIFGKAFEKLRKRKC